MLVEMDKNTMKGKMEVKQGVISADIANLIYSVNDYISMVKLQQIK